MSESAEAPKETPQNVGISKLDLIMRIVGAIGTLASALTMATANESLALVAEVVQFKTQYKDLPAFSFFVVSNALVCTYLVLSLVLSILHIFKSDLKITRLILTLCDTVMLALLTAGASAAAVIVHLAHNGNVVANWLGICHQFNYFCERITGSLVGSFLSVLVIMMLIMLSAIALSRT